MPASEEEQATQVLPATGEQPAAVSEQPTVVEPAQPVEQPTVVDTAQPTEAIPPQAPVRDLPAGVDPNELADAPIASARRGKLRRRLRYLRAVRDLLLRDLGGFTYEIQRSAGGTAQEAHRRLIDAKTNRIAALDTEVRGLESRLGEPHSGALLREPGIGGTCPECGELHASDAHYCARCGAPLDAKARARRDAAVAAAVHQTTASHAATPEPAPASVLWAAGPHPDRKPEADDDEDTHPSLATSQWLALRPHAPAEEAPKGGESAKGEPAATGDESAATSDEPGATSSDSPATGSDSPATGSEPAAKADEAAADTPATADEPDAGEEPMSERTAAWLGAVKPAKDSEEADAPAPQTVAAKRAGARTRATGAEKTGAVAKPKRPRAKKPASPESGEGGETAAPTGEESPAKPKRTRAKKPAPAPDFTPEPNGRRDEPVTPPHGDPLTSRPEQGS